jgi:hypothetical protein
MIKKLFPYILSLFFGFNTLKAQDSLKNYNINEIVVESKKQDEELEIKKSSLKTIYNFDLTKELTSEIGVTTINQISSEIRIHNLSEPFVGFYYDNTSIRIMGSKTQFYGAYSFINPDLYYLEVEPVSYSTKYTDLGGIVKIKPRKFTGKSIEISSDLAQRILTLKLPIELNENIKGYNNSSIRNIEVIGLMRNAIPNLQLLPRVVEFQNISSLDIKNSNLELIIRRASEENNFDKSTEYGNGELKQNSLQDLIILNNYIPFEKFDINSIFSYEFNNLYSKYGFKNNLNDLDFFNKNITGSFEISNENKMFKSGLTSYLMQNKKKSISVNHLWGEINYPYKFYLFQPSLGATKFEDKFVYLYGFHLSKDFENLMLTLGYNHLSNFILNNSYKIGELINENNKINAQIANHYSLSLNFKEENNIFKVLVYRKDLNADFQEEYSKARIYGLDLNLNHSGKLNYKVNSSFSNSRLNDHVFPGAIDKTIQTEFGYEIFNNINLITQLKYQDGYYSKNKITNNYEKLNNSLYLSFGGNTNFDFMNKTFGFTFTVYNLFAPLGQKNELARVKNAKDELISINTPLWLNIGIYSKF